MKRIINPKFSLTLVFLFVLAGLLAQTGNKIEKSYTWNYDLGSGGVVQVDNYDCDLIIHTWEKENAEFKLHVIAEMKSSDDKKTLDTHINTLKFENSPGKVSLETRFWESRRNIMGRKTIRLKRGKTLTYKNLKIKAEIWMPETANLELNSKYSNIELEKQEGNVVLDLYNDKLFSGSISGDLNITAKYTSFEFKDCKDITANLYDCNFTSLEAGKCEYISKYSKISSTSVLDLTIDSYTDKYTFETCGDIDIKSKYTDLKTKKAGKVKIDSYEGSYELDNCLSMEIFSKYTDFETESVNDLLATNIYEGSIICSKINYLTIKESKYVKYKLGLLNESLKLETGYEDDFYIDELGSGFKSLDLNGKYLKCETVFNNDLDLKFLASIKYPHLDIESVDLETKIKIKESSSLEYEAYKGKLSDDMPFISLSGYEIRFTFK
jgi:hypothetical protein